MANTTSKSPNRRKRALWPLGIALAAALGAGWGGLAIYSRLHSVSAPRGTGAGVGREETGMALAVRQAPQDAAPRLRLIEFLLSQRRNTDALDAAREATRALPQDRDVRAAYAETPAATGRLREAIQLLAREAPAKAGRRLQLARYLIQDSQLEQGAFLARSLSTPTPGQALTAAQLLIDARRPEEAVALLQPVVRRAPGGELRNHTGFALLLAGRYSEAAEQPISGSRENPAEPTLPFYAGSALCLSGDPARLPEAEAT